MTSCGHLHSLPLLHQDKILFTLLSSSLPSAGLLVRPRLVLLRLSWADRNEDGFVLAGPTALHLACASRHPGFMPLQMVASASWSPPCRLPSPSLCRRNVNRNRRLQIVGSVLLFAPMRHAFPPTQLKPWHQPRHYSPLTAVEYMVTSLGLCPEQQLFDLKTSIWHALVLLTKETNRFVCVPLNKWCFNGIQSLSVWTR